jgi:DNA/RNA-binding domain of Phe-tRNA-synthetase-like protein
MTDHAMPVSVTVDGDVFAAHPDYVALVVLAEGIGNRPSDDGTAAVLDAAEQHLLARTPTRPADHPHIAAWRTAFSAFGAKPSKYPCSARSAGRSPFQRRNPAPRAR